MGGCLISNRAVKEMDGLCANARIVKQKGAVSSLAMHTCKSTNNLSCRTVTRGVGWTTTWTCQNATRSGEFGT